MSRFPQVLLTTICTAAALTLVACVTSAGPRPVTAFAASSLTDAFTQLKARLPPRDPPLKLTYSFAGSQALVQQVIQGAPADVVATADQNTMQKLVDQGLVGRPRVFARNTLEIVVAPGNPKRVEGLADLSRSDVSVVLEEPSVPAGRYSQQILASAHVTVKPRSLELDVRSTLAKVTSGEADAAIVYVTDVRSAAGKATGIPIPAGQNVVASYPIAVVKASVHAKAAAEFIDDLLSAAGQRVLVDAGFLPAKVG
jgi:molybdate transport system substrate-binding protein